MGLVVEIHNTFIMFLFSGCCLWLVGEIMMIILVIEFIVDVILLYLSRLLFKESCTYNTVSLYPFWYHESEDKGCFMVCVCI